MGIETVEQKRALMAAGINAGKTLREMHVQDCRERGLTLDFCKLRELDRDIERCQKQLDAMT